MYVEWWVCMPVLLVLFNLQLSVPFECSNNNSYVTTGPFLPRQNRVDKIVVHMYTEFRSMTAARV